MLHYEAVHPIKRPISTFFIVYYRINDVSKFEILCLKFSISLKMD